ncbi:MAG: putative transport protein [uncultured marine phage]|uniref:Putative transport protein n=1 Tax=uncultured marine phage TaxID=707152 RepID=A0A8D9CC94_9VIRU|nr:MAG: putative transport protein [uncultured marine phage]
MKKLLFILFLFITSISFSQDTTSTAEAEIFNEEWWESLDQKVNFVVFPNPTTKRIIQFRIYRGDCEEYNVYITDQSGKLVYEDVLKKEDEMDLNGLTFGVYFIEAVDLDGNRVTNKIFLK